MKNALPTIEKLKFSDLVIDNMYSGRTEKDINENAKSKQKELEAFGGWNPALPGNYALIDGEKHLTAGFSRVKASQLNGETEGYFVEVPADRESLMLACITTNSTRSLSALQQGARFEELASGVVSDDFAGQFADPKKAEDWKHQPMSNQDIAGRIGKSSEWVRKCRAIYNSPAPIAEMIENEQIAVTVFDGAKSIADKHYDGSEAKMEKICRRAIAVAKEDGKETATEKHFKAIKDEFIPQPKLIADGAVESTKPKGDKDDSDDDKKKAEAEERGRSFQEKENLFLDLPKDEAKPASKKEQADRRKVLAAILVECSDEYSWSASDTDIDGAVEKIIAAIDVF